MASVDIRTLPGLYGGGFARVIEVQALGRQRTAESGEDALVRFQRLKDPLQSFGETLTTYLTDKNIIPEQKPRLSSAALTLLQQIESDQPLGPQLPPLGPQLPPLGETGKGEQTRQNEQDKVNESALATPEQDKQAFGPDLVKMLEEQAQKTPVEFESLRNIDSGAIFGGTANLLAAQSAFAAQAYAAGLAGTSAPETSLVA